MKRPLNAREATFENETERRIRAEARVAALEAFVEELEADLEKLRLAWVERGRRTMIAEARVAELLAHKDEETSQVRLGTRSADEEWETVTEWAAHEANAFVARMISRGALRIDDEAVSFHLSLLLKEYGARR